jgi:hypothetical protein
MLPRELTDHLRDPSGLSPEDLDSIRNLVMRFPYFAPGQVLYAYELFRENSLDFSPQLKKAAAYAPDRRKMRKLMSEARLQASGDEQPIPAVMKEVLPEPEPLPEPVEMGTDAPVIAAVITEPEPKRTEEELLAIVRQRLAEIMAEREITTAETGIPAESETDEPKTALPGKNELIEKFILTEPRISPPKPGFFSPHEYSLKSNRDEEEIISETLALLYASQGNIERAIRIYRKLILLFPEKSGYFADQINKLEE